MTRLITVDKADFVVSNVGFADTFFAHEAICAQNKKIMFTTLASLDEFTQKVLDDYDQFKYFFKLFPVNTTSNTAILLDDVLTVAKYSQFTKVGLLYQDLPTLKMVMNSLKSSLPAHGFEVVYINSVPPSTTDFTSQFSAIEKSGAQILVVFIVTRAAVPFVKEWCDRESPFLVLGFMPSSGDPDFWDVTGGKCEYTSAENPPGMAGYPLTNKTSAMRDTYLRRWGT